MLNHGGKVWLLNIFPEKENLMVLDVNVVRGLRSVFKTGVTGQKISEVIYVVPASPIIKFLKLWHSTECNNIR